MYCWEIGHIRVGAFSSHLVLVLTLNLNIVIIFDKNNFNPVESVDTNACEARHVPRHNSCVVRILTVLKKTKKSKIKDHVENFSEHLKKEMCKRKLQNNQGLLAPSFTFILQNQLVSSTHHSLQETKP